MKKGFLLSSSSSSSSKAINERNKPSSAILPDDQSQSQKSSSNPVSNALLDFEEDTTNKGSSHHNDDDNNDNDDCITVPDEGTAVVSIQRQRRLDRMSVRRQTTYNYSLAQQHQHHWGNGNSFVKSKIESSIVKHVLKWLQSSWRIVENKIENNEEVMTTLSHS